jgi:hypothetical protein
MRSAVTVMWKKKPTLLLTVGTALALTAGGATAWWLLQRTPISELPTGADVLPQDTALSLSFTNDEGQWRRLRQYGTADSQASFDRGLATWRDRLFTANGINYERDVRPWVGEEITVAFLNPLSIDEAASDQVVRPYRTPNTTEFDRSAVMILPIADADRAQRFISSPRVTADQEWVDREYKGEKIREVHGETQLDYAATLLDDRFLVVSGDAQSIEQVIDTLKGKASVAQNSDYGRAFSQLRETVANPFMRLYVNVPAATEFTASNPNQPLPPQLLSLLQKNQGLASAMSLESDGVRFRGTTWVAANSRLRLKVQNSAERIPVLLPSQTVLMASGDNLKEFWENYSEPMPSSETTASNLQRRVWSPDVVRQTFRSFTGLDWDKEVIPWTEGEFTLSLLSAPAAANSVPTAGLVLMMQASDRKAADETFTKLDQAMQERNGWQVQEAQLEGQPVTTWTSPFAALTVTRGWLDGNIVYVAIGSGVAEAVVPSPESPLATSNLFQSATATDLEAASGHFFMAVDQLVNPNINLPLPTLPDGNRQALSAIRAIGLTTSVQDNRTTRHDVRVLMPRSDRTPPALPPASAEPEPSPTTSP